MKSLIAAMVLLSTACSASSAKRSWCDPNDPYTGGSSDGVRAYFNKCVADPTGPKGMKGHIEEDVEAERKWEKVLAEEYNHKLSLRRALVTRVLSAKEMSEVLSAGSDLFVDAGMPFRQEDIDRQFEHALRVQTELLEIERIKGHGRG